MEQYITLNSHRIGKSHIQSRLTCEDYSLSYSDEDVSIAVISDGHGDRNCFRSGMGAKLACEIAIASCRKFQIESMSIVDLQDCDIDGILQKLETEITETWKNAVFRDAQEQPFTEEELLQASEQAQESYRAGNRLEKAYGCTLIVAVISKRYWFGLQIGDGKCVAAYDDGVYVEPIPADDENCCGNRSTSLCNTNAPELFRHYFSTVCPVSVFVVSDGVEESFDQGGLFNCFYSVAYWLKDAGYDNALSKLNELLPQISEGGSGDDVSLAAIVSQRSAFTKPRQSLEQVYERVRSCSEVLSRYNALLRDSVQSLEEKEQKVADLSAEIEQTTKHLAALQLSLEETEEQRQVAESAQAEAQEKQKMAADQMDKALKYKESAENYWRGKLEVLGLPFTTDEIISTSSDTVATEDAKPVREKSPTDRMPTDETPAGKSLNDEDSQTRSSEIAQTTAMELLPEVPTESVVAQDDLPNADGSVHLDGDLRLVSSGSEVTDQSYGESTGAFEPGALSCKGGESAELIAKDAGPAPRVKKKRWPFG